MPPPCETRLCYQRMIHFSMVRVFRSRYFYLVFQCKHYRSHHSSIAIPINSCTVVMPRAALCDSTIAKSDQFIHRCYATSSPVWVTHRSFRSIHASPAMPRAALCDSAIANSHQFMYRCYATSNPVRLTHRKFRSIHALLLCHGWPIHASLLCHAHPGATQPSDQFMHTRSTIPCRLKLLVTSRTCSCRKTPSAG